MVLGICVIFHNASYFIGLFRVPIFFTGIEFGKLAYEKKELNKKSFYGCICMFFWALIGEEILNLTNHLPFIRYDYKYFMHYFTTIGLCITVSALLDKATKCKFRILSFLGGITLEIYLLHEYVLRRINAFSRDTWGYYPFDSYRIIYNIIVFIIVAILSFGIHWIVNIPFRKK